MIKKQVIWTEKDRKSRFLDTVQLLNRYLFSILSVYSIELNVD